ncbi:hypothetical protein PS2_011730 [Malus domestica]
MQIETCIKVENILTRFDRSGTRVRVLPFHSALAQGSLANVEEFTNSNSKEVSQFLVCTDRAPRGIDFSVWIMLYSSTSLAIQVCATCRKNSQSCCRNREGIHLCDVETSLPCRKDNGKKPRSPGA